MTQTAAMAALEEAFPDADDFIIDTGGFGFAEGFGVRFGTRRHAVRLSSWADAEQGIATLRKWTGRRSDQRRDAVDTAAG